MTDFRRYLTAAVLAVATTANAQNIGLAVSHRAPDSTLVTNFSLGLRSHTDSLRGLQLNLLGNSANVGRGVQVNAIGNMAGRLDGLQLSGLMNAAIQPIHGVQLAGITNIAAGVDRGVQLAALLNVSSATMRGLQLGAYNYTDSLSGSQVGLVNVARSHPRGWQIGLVNYTRDTVAHKIGLVNVNPNTTVDLMLYGGTSSKLNIAARFRNRSTYSIIGLGTHYMGLDKKFSGALFYRLGQYFHLGERWTLGGDIGYYHIETFEHHTADRPQRLYSLQARLNADYQISPRLGAYAAVGFGETRYYRHNSHYRSRPLVEAGLTWRYNRSGQHATGLPPRSDEEPADGLMAPAVAKRPWTAIAEAAGVNVLVHCFDRFVLNEDFAQTTLHTIRHNFRQGFVWDNDQFSTNLFAHPYHGNLYYNSARSNGLSFWQSAPYAMGGSLMWEFFGEIEPPAINDLIATTMGGICIGEVMHRVSDIILNDRQRGFGRFLREAAATIIDPMKGFNRIITGRAWRYDAQHYLYHDHARYPVDLAISFGDRYLADNGALFRGEHNPYLNFYLEYGDPLNEGEHNRPFDFFDAEVTFGLSGNQPIINGLHLLGRIWSTPMISGKGVNAEVGIYQHFNYYDSKPVKDGSDLTPYRISEAAALGPGIIFQLPEVGSLTRLEQRVFLSGILLGGTKSDYYNIIDRDYNMGSGFSIKSKTHLELRNFGRFILHAKYFQLYTWKGYEGKDLATIDPIYLNAQGDRGNARLLVVNPIVEFDVRQQLSVVLSGSYFTRRTHYKYYDDINARTFEVRLGLAYHL